MKLARLAKILVMVVLLALVVRLVPLGTLARTMVAADPVLLAVAVGVVLGDRAFGRAEFIAWLHER